MAEDFIHFRIVRSGDRIELVKYASPVRCGVERDFVIQKKSKEDLDGTEEKRSDNLYRARQNIRRLVWSNVGPYTKFLTLTYKNTILDVDTVRKHLATFFKGMSRAGYKLKYLYVLEHQKERGLKEGNEGCLHVHIVLFHDKYIPWVVIKRYWKHGSIDIHALRKIQNVGAYVCKYITKENLADFGSHTYACSKGLQRSYESCFYTSGWSDHFADDWTFDRIMQDLKIDFHGVKTFDMRLKRGAEPYLLRQKVDYYQGSFVEHSLVDLQLHLSHLYGDCEVEFLE